MDKDLALLHEKIDYLTSQIEAQRQRQEGVEELLQDTIPIVNHMIKLSVDELDEIGRDFQAEDLLFLLKRVLRDTHLLTSLLDQLESVAELVRDGQVIGKRAFQQTVEELDHMERLGYFAFAGSGMYVVDRLVKEFDPDTVRTLGDEMITALKAEIPEKTSLAYLLRALNDPATRRGLARLLHLLTVLGFQPRFENPEVKSS